MKFFHAIILIFLFSSTYFSQTNNKSEDFRLVKTKPSAYITFEKFVIREPRFVGENRERILLRFNNNTKWNLTIPTLACRTNEDECMLFYTIDQLSNSETSANKCEFPQLNRIMHVASVKTIESGKSILFTIPKEHLADGLFIQVGFSYEWENGGDSGGTSYIIHEVPFFSSDLPKVKSN